LSASGGQFGWQPGGGDVVVVLVEVVVVVTLTMFEYPEFPAVLVARTRYRYVVAAVRPELVNEVVVEVPTCEKFVQLAPWQRSIW
jgi:hypothetical protein